MPRCQCLPAFCTFFVAGIVLVPLAVFALGAIFAAMLYAIECSEAKNAFGEDTSTWTDEQLEMCSFYEWWLYIIGNLVGVSIADVDVSSSHVLAAVLDLLISVWSLTIAGLVIGLVGSLAWVSLITESADEALTNRFSKAMAFSRLARQLAEGEGRLDFEAFEALCSEKDVTLSAEDLRAAFDKADVDKSGTIDASEVDALIASIPTSSSKSSVEDLGARMASLEAKMDLILANVVQPLRDCTPRD